jgi:hypothetical protein
MGIVGGNGSQVTALSVSVGNQEAVSPKSSFLKKSLKNVTIHNPLEINQQPLRNVIGQRPGANS